MDKSVFQITENTQYIALYCEEFGEDWPRYSGTL